MEKIFQPGKWFIIFCAILVSIWVSLQLVIKMRLTEEAKQITNQVFSWNWPALGCTSKVFKITTIKIKKLSSSDAKIQILAIQKLVYANRTNSQEIPCTIELTFYHSNNHWKLGSLKLD